MFNQARTRLKELKKSRDPIAVAHEHCSRHRVEIERSHNVGCFYCCQTYEASLIDIWVGEDDTALCTKCGIDAVVGDASGFPITDQSFLKSMNKVWF
jgi:hypothetical protein